MEITVKEIPFKEFVEGLGDVDDGYYMGTNAFITEGNPLNEMLAWEGARLFHCKVEGKHHAKWVVVRPFDPAVHGDGVSHWHFFEWSSGYDYAITGITLVLYGYRTLGRYTGILGGDGFNDCKGFDEMITALTAVKESYNLFDNTHLEKS